MGAEGQRDTLEILGSFFGTVCLHGISLGDTSWQSIHAALSEMAGLLLFEHLSSVV